MNVRIHWAVGTAILVTVCVLPLLLWLDELDRHAWVATLLIATIVAIILLVLFVKWACEACENTLQLTSSTDAEQLEEIPEEVFCPACSSAGQDEAMEMPVHPVRMQRAIEHPLDTRAVRVCVKLFIPLLLG